MSEIDEEIRGEVLSEIYCQIEALDWDGLSTRERSRCYEGWVNDPLIGDKLARYIPREKVRVWIKDGAGEGTAAGSKRHRPKREVRFQSLPDGRSDRSAGDRTELASGPQHAGH